MPREPFKGGAHQDLDAPIVTQVGPGFTHSFARFSFTETKVSQASKRLRRDIRFACARPSAVSGSVRVPKTEAAWIALSDE